MSENLDNSEEIASLEARLRAWEARNGKLYEGLKFKDWEDARVTKERIFSEYMSEYNEIKSRLEELRPTPPAQKTFSDKHPILMLIGFALGIVAFFVALNLVVQDETPPPGLSDSELWIRCITSIPSDWPQTMIDNAVENCAMIGLND